MTRELVAAGKLRGKGNGPNWRETAVDAARCSTVLLPTTQQDVLIALLGQRSGESVSSRVHSAQVRLGRVDLNDRLDAIAALVDGGLVRLVGILPELTPWGEFVVRIAGVRWGRSPFEGGEQT